MKYISLALELIVNVNRRAYFSLVILVTPKYGGVAATAWAARRGLAAAAAPVAPSSQHAADTSHAAAVPDAVVATAAAAASCTTLRDSDALLAVCTCSVVSTSRSHASPAARGGSEPAF